MVGFHKIVGGKALLSSRTKTWLKLFMFGILKRVGRNRFVTSLYIKIQFYGIVYEFFVNLKKLNRRNK